jgi:acetyl-CoA acetyltransferase
MFRGMIVGIGESRVGRRPSWTAVELQAEATLAALDDSGLTPRDVDGVFNLGPHFESIADVRAYPFRTPAHARPISEVDPVTRAVLPVSLSPVAR